MVHESESSHTGTLVRIGVSLQYTVFVGTSLIVSVHHDDGFNTWRTTSHVVRLSPSKTFDSCTFSNSGKFVFIADYRGDFFVLSIPDVMMSDQREGHSEDLERISCFIDSSTWVRTSVRSAITCYERFCAEPVNNTYFHIIIADFSTRNVIYEKRRFELDLSCTANPIVRENCERDVKPRAEITAESLRMWVAGGSFTRSCRMVMSSIQWNNELSYSIFVLMESEWGLKGQYVHLWGVKRVPSLPSTSIGVSVVDEYSNTFAIRHSGMIRIFK